MTKSIEGYVWADADKVCFYGDPAAADEAHATVYIGENAEASAAERWAALNIGSADSWAAFWSPGGGSVISKHATREAAETAAVSYLIPRLGCRLSKKSMAEPADVSLNQSEQLPRSRSLAAPSGPLRAALPVRRFDRPSWPPAIVLPPLDRLLGSRPSHPEPTFAPPTKLAVFLPNFEAQHSPHPRAPERSPILVDCIDPIAGIPAHAFVHEQLSEAGPASDPRRHAMDRSPNKGETASTSPFETGARVKPSHALEAMTQGRLRRATLIASLALAAASAITPLFRLYGGPAPPKWEGVEL